MKNKIIILTVSAVILFGAGVGTGYIVQNLNNKSDDTASKTITEAPIIITDNNTNGVSKVVFEISYKGEDGKTALELLQKAATIKTTGTGENAYVSSISNVVANPTNEYWQFFINDESSMVGAGSYTTNSTDIITWKLSSF
jgi:hypothetical protein